MRLFLNVMLWACLSACGGSGDSDSTVNSTPVIDVNWQPAAASDWPISTAAAEAMDGAALQQAFNRAAGLSPMHALLVVRNGKLIGEAYYHDQQRDSLQHLRSVTKTITMLMIGKAIELGAISSVHQPIAEFTTEDYSALLSDKADITIAHLLDMSSGIEWDESTAQGYNDWVSASDPVEYVLQRPLVSAPSSQFNYNSGTSHLLSYILTKATGLSLAEFTKLHLFTPLGINEFNWETLDNGLSNGAAGLTLRARDLAKIGVLLQQQGRWQSQQVIAASWVLQAAAVSQPLNQPLGGLELHGYGQQWWLGSTSAGDFQLGWGFGGQFVLTMPEQNLTIVLLQNFQAGVPGQTNAAMQLIRQHILPAL
ncbi:serine hydrolase domain-containing protein [Arsukibacterium tuosuense]|uniref:serine hydrolase domain-containing protein n=1 Tax=Arsukibacterium tuosuense TaxID=1323745 RepID=UPI001483AA00|nr:serine hydrolase domain-containing protein [Arsukibacterium tuosuense]